MQELGVEIELVLFYLYHINMQELGVEIEPVCGRPVYTEIPGQFLLAEAFAP